MSERADGTGHDAATAATAAPTGADVVAFPAPEVPAEPADDGYDGPAHLIHPGGETAVQVTLRGHFDPISGRYAWYGRVTASPEVAHLVEGGVRAVRLRTPYAQVETTLSDVDPWGRPRVEGFGVAPFEVLDAVPDDTA